MKANRAGDLGTDAARYYAVHDDYTERQANAVNTAVTLQARDYLPDAAHAAVLEYRDGLPVLLAATDEHLYVMDVEGVEEIEPATTRCRKLRLDPKRASITTSVRYRGSHTFGMYRKTTWRLRIEDVAGVLDLLIPGHIDVDGEADEYELLGQHLAQRLGWEFPSVEQAARTA